MGECWQRDTGVHRAVLVQVHIEQTTNVHTYNKVCQKHDIIHLGETDDLTIIHHNEVQNH